MNYRFIGTSVESLEEADCLYELPFDIAAVIDDTGGCTYLLCTSTKVAKEVRAHLSIPSTLTRIDPYLVITVSSRLQKVIQELVEIVQWDSTISSKLRPPAIVAVAETDGEAYQLLGVETAGVADIVVVPGNFSLTDIFLSLDCYVYPILATIPGAVRENGGYFAQISVPGLTPENVHLILTRHMQNINYE